MSDTEGPAWRLIEQAAVTLTEAGRTPFTQKDIVDQVQQLNPRYGRNSLSPVIRSLTDNTEGAAEVPGGRHILHRIARGKYQLLGGSAARQKGETESGSPAADTQLIGGFEFRYMGEIRAERGPDGAPRAFRPHERYSNRRGLALHRYGSGPFCAFAMPELPAERGVYVIRAGDSMGFVEACDDLDHRINAGHGSISPRNCYRGGQKDCCRINTLVLEAARAGTRVTLWFRPSSAPEAEAQALRETVDLAWTISECTPRKVGAG